MNKATYTATVNKLAKAYEALELAADDAAYFDKQVVRNAQYALERAANALAGQVCRDCHNTGYLKGKARAAHDVPSHVAISCVHANVPVLGFFA